MMKIAAAAALVLTLTSICSAQEFRNQNGNVVDGMGGGGNKSNGYIYDGPTGPGASGLYYVPSDSKARRELAGLVCPDPAKPVVPCIELSRRNSATGVSGN